MRTYWNYRIIRGPDPFDANEISYSFAEVHYEGEEPNLIGKDPIVPFGRTLEELHSEMMKMLEAFKKPIIDEPLPHNSEAE